MESCSVGSILNSKCGAWKNNSYFKIDVDEVPLGKVELLHIQSKIKPFTDVIVLWPRHKLKVIDNFSNAHRYKCADPFSGHKTLHKVLLSEYSSFFAQYEILPGQCFCMKCLKRAKDSDSEDNVPKDNVNEIWESDINMEKDEMFVEMACNI